MMNFANLMVFFSTYSFLGWAIETAFASLNERKFINRGFLNGFVCPIYGFCAILIFPSSKVIGYFFENKLIVLLLNVLLVVILVTVFEYITGFLLERLFNCKCWDYSQNFLNINGYICLKYSLLWGVLIYLLLQVVHPAVSGIIFLIPMSIKECLTVILILYFFVDIIKSIVATVDLRETIMNYSKISVNKYYDKIFRYKRFFSAFPRLLILNAGVINRDIRSILNDRMYKIKIELKKRFL